MAFLNSKRFQAVLLSLFILGLFGAGFPAVSEAGSHRLWIQDGNSRMDFADDLTTPFYRREKASHRLENGTDQCRIARGSIQGQRVEFKSYSVRNSQVQFSVEPGRAGVLKTGNATNRSNKTVVLDKQAKFKIDKEISKGRSLLSLKSKFGTISGSRLGYYLLGLIYTDFNGNGLHDPGEPGIPDVLVEIHHEKKGKLGWVVSDSTGRFDTKALSSSAFHTHEFIIPEATDAMSKPYTNGILSAYFNYVPAPEGYELAEVTLGFALDADALLSDLANNSITVNGLSPDQWSAKLGGWSRPYMWTAGGQTVSGLEVLKDNNASLEAQFPRELLTLELNLRSRLGLSPSNPAFLSLQEILVEYGHYLLARFDHVTEEELVKVLQIFQAINGG